MHKGFDGNTGEDIGRESGVRIVRSMGSSTCSIPPSPDLSVEHRHAVEDHNPAEAGFEAGSVAARRSRQLIGAVLEPRQRWLSGGQPLVLGAVSPEAVMTCTTPPAVGSS
jgi:hypothetical protein